MKEITNQEDVALLVHTFYDKVKRDEQLAPFFTHLDFETHMPKMIHFWSFVLLDVSGYTTNVTEKHLSMPLKKEHFERWLELFYETLDALFVGEKVKIAKDRAKIIAWTIESKVK
jgi:hemoglobin